MTLRRSQPPVDNSAHRKSFPTPWASNLRPESTDGCRQRAARQGETRQPALEQNVCTEHFLTICKGTFLARQGWKSREKHQVFLLFGGKLASHVGNLILCRFGLRLGPCVITCDFESQQTHCVSLGILDIIFGLQVISHTTPQQK